MVRRLSEQKHVMGGGVMRLAYGLFLASACGFIRADEPAVYATDDAKPEVVLEDAPTRIEEAMKRLGGRTKKLDDKLAVIQAAYSEGDTRRRNKNNRLA
ncbi:hypothetical protein [Rosistilla oblonga]|nr:hypothetical protein [Rosistilla oblonga]